MIAARDQAKGDANMMSLANFLSILRDAKIIGESETYGANDPIPREKWEGWLDQLRLGHLKSRFDYNTQKTLGAGSPVTDVVVAKRPEPTTLIEKLMKEMRIEAMKTNCPCSDGAVLHAYFDPRARG